jgi:hypothetical protein
MALKTLSCGELRLTYEKSMALDDMATYVLVIFQRMLSKEPRFPYAWKSENGEILVNLDDRRRKRSCHVKQAEKRENEKERGKDDGKRNDKGSHNMADFADPCRHHLRQ